VKVNLLPCPCCGNKKLYFGHVFSTSMGIECDSVSGGCGLSIRRNYPSKMPRGLKDLKELDQHLLNLASKAWNKRVNK
jgi:hypothetical protein